MAAIAEYLILKNFRRGLFTALYFFRISLRSLNAGKEWHLAFFCVENKEAVNSLFHQTPRNNINIKAPS